MAPQQENRGPRQAVVLIHGIGEQRPMATLRAFVDALVERPAATKAVSESSHTERSANLGVGTLKDRIYYSKPDRLSNT